MKQNKPSDNTFENRVAQFQKKEKLSSDATTLRSRGKAPKHPDKVARDNPYLQARIEILTNYPKWRQKEIGEMERTGNINNRHYDAFVKEIADLGDSFSQ